MDSNELDRYESEVTGLLDLLCLQIEETMDGLEGISPVLLTTPDLAQATEDGAALAEASLGALMAARETFRLLRAKTNL
jgi:hypothetical protein